MSGPLVETGTRVCVTGGLGFIGGHLCAALLEAGHEVVCVDRAASPRAVPGVLDPRALQGVRVIHADVSSAPIEPLIEGAGVVVHLAALPGVRVRHPLGDLRRHNSRATARIAAALAPGQRLVVASTSSVYGDAERLPTDERCRPAPLNPYARTKLEGELAALDAARGGADVVVCRLFTVFGPGQRPDMAFARWIESVCGGRPLQWCAQPDARREFTYVGDAVRGLAAAAARGRAGEVYNVAGAGSWSVLAALREIERVTGRRARMTVRPACSEAVATAACGRKAERELGYVPEVGLREGIARQVDAALAQELPRVAV